MKLCAVGCGEHATSSHGPSQALFASRHSELELAACCDLDPGRAERYRARFRFARAYTEATVMLDAEKPDAVVLVVPVEAAPALAEAILERGVPLLLEKPPGRTAAEVDRLIEAARRGGRGGESVPHQVAFNRRFVPLVRELRERLAALGGPSRIQHLHYEMTRVGRRDPDFSTTAIHGIDAVRFLARSDYAHVRFRYQERPELGAGVANVFLDAAMASGATAHLAFCPAAGVVVERVAVHAQGETFYLQVPMWGAFDSPGRLQHLREGKLVDQISGDASESGSASPEWHLGGFYAEYEAFLGALAAGRPPGPTLEEARQSVALAEHMRRRCPEFRA